MIAPLIKDHIDAHLLPKNMIEEGYKYSRNDLRLRGKELLADYKCGFTVEQNVKAEWLQL